MNGQTDVSTMEVQIRQSLYKENPWISLPDADWSELIKVARLISFKKGEIIYHQNLPTSYVYLVKTGRVNLSILSETGDEKGLYIASKGCIFGETIQMDPVNNSAQATAKTDCSIYTIENQVFFECMHNYSVIADNVCTIMAKKIRLLTGQIEMLSFFDANSRVCEMLTYLSEKYGILQDEGNLIDMRFTHQELADMVGASRVTVTNIMNSLTADGIIKKVRGKYLIVDKDNLRRKIDLGI